jgi:hypothetical protein
VGAISAPRSPAGHPSAPRQLTRLALIADFRGDTAITLTWRTGWPGARGLLQDTQRVATSIDDLPPVGAGPSRRRIVRLLGYLAITGLVGADSLSRVSAWQDWTGSQKHIKSCPVSSESWR